MPRKPAKLVDGNVPHKINYLKINLKQILIRRDCFKKQIIAILRTRGIYYKPPIWSANICLELMTVEGPPEW